MTSWLDMIDSYCTLTFVQWIVIAASWIKEIHVGPETPPGENTSGSHLVKQAVYLRERVCDWQVEEVCKVSHSQPLSLQLPGSPGQLLQRCVGALRSQPADTQPRHRDLVPHLHLWPHRSCDVLLFPGETSNAVVNIYAKRKEKSFCWTVNLGT